MKGQSEAHRADFIDDGVILDALRIGRMLAQDSTYVHELLRKAGDGYGLTHREAAVLLHAEDPDILDGLFEAAGRVKDMIYGNRIVLFAPLYISSYCVNECDYCGYKVSNAATARRRLSLEELAAEVRVLQSLGHKRIVLEAGDDPRRCPMDYVLECIETVYSVKTDKGSIRRINVNVAAATEQDYARLAASGIGTYILFQETYHQPTYAAVHRKGPKRDFDWHATAMDRAMRAGIDDVGLGVLYGLHDYKYDTVGMLLHAEHLENAFGVGPHTVSVPRLRKAEGVELGSFPHLVNDREFMKIVAVLRLSVPYAGLILSTREEPSFRDHVLRLGVSQISAGSCTGVGGYVRQHVGGYRETPQFEVGDHRSPLDIVKQLCRDGYVPSFCTACYREGRTGDRFMQLAKSGTIHNVCRPNSLLTLKEYMIDYGDATADALGDAIIKRELEDIPNRNAKRITTEYLRRTERGERDLHL